MSDHVNIPFHTFKHAVCRSMSGCGVCEKCLWLRENQPTASASMVMQQQLAKPTPGSVSRIRKDELLMQVAHVFAQRSTCHRHKVGCVITTADMRNIVSVGYNGVAAGLTNGCLRPATPGNCGCLHAEDNALSLAPGGYDNLVLFTTLLPCETCAQRIINHAIAEVHYDRDYRDHSGIELLRRAGVSVWQTHAPAFPPLQGDHTSAQ